MTRAAERQTVSRHALLASLIVLAACGGKDKIDRSKLDAIVNKVGTCRDLECAQAAYSEVGSMLAAGTHGNGLAQADIDLLSQARKVIEAKMAVIKQDAAGAAAPRLSRHDLFSLAYATCRITFADAHPDAQGAALIERLAKSTQESAAKLGVAIPPQPHPTGDLHKLVADRLAYVAGVIESLTQGAHDYPGRDRLLLGIGFQLCALWATYTPGDASAGAMADTLAKAAPAAGLDAVLVADVIAKVKANAPGPDVGHAADAAMSAIFKQVE
jgi:hypothetical protein